jgi:hypothetical protein
VDAADGFVELVNFSDRPVDLSGWTLVNGPTVVTLPRATALAPGQPLVVARNAAALRTRFGAVPAVVELPGLTLDARRGTLELRRSGKAVDAVAWGTPDWSLDGKAPLCRLNPGKDTDTLLDWNPADKASPGIAGCGE